jgi:hypothetical protein
MFVRDFGAGEFAEYLQKKFISKKDWQAFKKAIRELQSLSEEEFRKRLQKRARLKKIG